MGQPLDLYSSRNGIFVPNRFYSGSSVNPPVNNRQRMKGGVTLTPEQSQQRANLDYVRNFSHNLFINSAVARSVGRVFRLGVIGPGIELRSEVRRRNKDRKTGVYKFNDDLNEQITDDWNDWGRACTVDGQLSWYECTRKALTTMLESGDCFVRFYSVPAENTAIRYRSPIPFSLQLLESDMLDSNHSGQVSDPNEYWKDGIKYDRFGRPLAYGFRVIVRGNYETVEVPANEVIHLYLRDELRPNSRRGWPLLTSVIGVVDRMETYMATQLLHAEQNAAVSTYLIPPDYGNSAPPLGDEGDDPYADVVNRGNRGGGVVPLAPGTQVIERPQIAATQLDPFVTASLQQIAAAVGVTYEALALDFSRANFSSSRLATIMNSERFNELRQFLEREFFEVVWHRWLELTLLRPEYQRQSQDPADYHHSWAHKRLPYVDPQKSIAAAKLAYDLGLASLETLSHDNGYDFESEMRKRAQNNTLLEELGIELLSEKDDGDIPTSSDDSEQGQTGPEIQQDEAAAQS